MPVRLALLDSSWESMFWNNVSSDVPNYYFFILDWKLNRDKTKILLAIEDAIIIGSMLIYDERIVHIRGRPEAAKLLLNEVDLENAEFQVPLEHEALVLKKYKPLTRHEMILMTLQKGDENLQVRHPVLKLGSSEAMEIADLLGEEFPEWGDFTEKRITERLKNDVLFLGIKEDGKIASMGNTHILDFGSNIGMVVTRKGYRGRGFATSVVSALLRKILQGSELALIHVLSDNPSAIRVYTKAGFRLCETYAFIRGERIVEK